MRNRYTNVDTLHLNELLLLSLLCIELNNRFIFKNYLLPRAHGLMCRARQQGCIRLFFSSFDLIYLILLLLNVAEWHTHLPDDPHTAEVNSV